MGYQKALSFLSEFKNLIQQEDIEKFIFFPPAGLSLLFQSESLYWGVQNIYQQKEGAFTGENSAELFKEMGASFCLVGHSERRYLFGETDSEIEKKFSLLQESALIPILCIGEALSERFEKEKHLIKNFLGLSNILSMINSPFILISCQILLKISLLLLLMSQSGLSGRERPLPLMRLKKLCL